VACTSLGIGQLPRTPLPLGWVNKPLVDVPDPAGWEPTLTRRFVADYEAYRPAVPAWWPRPHPLDPASVTNQAQGDAPADDRHSMLVLPQATFGEHIFYAVGLNRR
jgi:hypothetical protein